MQATIAKRCAVAILRRLRHGRIELADAGSCIGVGPAQAPLRTRITVRSPRFWRSLLRGSRPLADAYAAGEWDCDDLVAVARIGTRETARLDRIRRPLAPIAYRLSRLPRNTRSGARRNIAAHYDIGNDLFELFLDDTMTYSCAYFARPDATLREAQEAKLDLACRKLELEPDDHLLEIGTGWGSLAIHAAARYGCRVTTTTISREQHAEASRRVAAAGLSDRVTILLRDYRDLEGRFDKLVSIEMIEAVGSEYFDLFFRRCGQLLRPHGTMLLQAIVIEDSAYALSRRANSFIMSRIFPGGCLPSRAVIERCVRRCTDMRAAGVQDLTAHYVQTLRHWRMRFIANAERVAALGYDIRFRRMWELYLAWCEGGFAERRIGDLQMVFARPASAALAPPLPSTPARRARARAPVAPRAGAA